MKHPAAPLLLAVICLLNPVSSSAQWAANGTGVCTLPTGQFHPAIGSDGAGGAIIAWEDSRNSGVTTDVDVYVQRLDPNGFPMWAAGGVAMCIDAGMQMTLQVVSDGANGAIVTWSDHRSGPATIYAQRVSSTGSMLWMANGVPLCTALPEQDFAVAVTDGAGGAIASWLDSRNGNFDVYAQRIDASGVVQWTAAGAAICTASGLQHSPFMTSDTNRVTVSGWSVTGVTRTPSARAVLAPNVPNPFSGTTSFEVVLDRESRVAVDVFDVTGRKVRSLEIVHAPAGRTAISFDGRDTRGGLLPSGEYFYRVRANGIQLTRKMLILR